MRGVGDILENGEDAFLAEIGRRFGRVPKGAGVVGIGDDAALLPGRPSRLISTDLLVEGTHFRWDLMSPRDLAHRAIESNLSDMAAMAAEPEALFLGLALGAGAREYVDPLVRALAEVSKRRGVPILGGDTTSTAARCTTLAVTVVGRPLRGFRAIRRSGARAGDLLAVSGALGAARLGLESLEGRVRWPRKRGMRAARDRAHAAYRRPVARLDFVGLLARHARAAMDLSDGLGLDLPRLAAASGCGFEVEEAALPVDRSLRFWAAARPESRAECTAGVLGGGEDFQILFAIAPKSLPAARRYAKRKNLTFQVIGRLTASGAGLLRPEGRDARPRPWPRQGWDPFCKSAPKNPPALDADTGPDVDPSGRPRKS